MGNEQFDFERGRNLFVSKGGPPDGFGYVTWLSDALNVSKQAVHKWNAGTYPAYVLACFELLEAIPPKRWPARWTIRGRALEKGRADHQPAPPRSM